MTSSKQWEISAGKTNHCEEKQSDSSLDYENQNDERLVTFTLLSQLQLQNDHRYGLNEATKNHNLHGKV